MSEMFTANTWTTQRPKLKQEISEGLPPKSVPLVEPHTFSLIRTLLLHSGSLLLLCLIVNLLLRTARRPQVLNDVSLHHGHVGSRVPASDGLPIRVNQKLFKVPFDVIELEVIPEETIGGIPEAEANRWAGVLQEGEQLLLLHPVHISLFKKLKIGDKPSSGPHVLEPFEDLVVASGFLHPKLVARKAQDDKAVGSQFFM